MLVSASPGVCPTHPTSLLQAASDPTAASPAKFEQGLPLPLRPRGRR